MDKRVIEQKLESLRRCIERIEEKRPASPALFADNPDLQDVIALNLTRAVQLCTDIAAHIISESGEPSPTTMSESFTALSRLGIIDQQNADNLRKAVGFRNIAVHNYEAISWEIVFNICHRQLIDFKRFAQAVVAHAQI